MVVILGALLLGGLLAWVAERWGEVWPRGVALMALAIAAASSLVPSWRGEVAWPWIPRLGVGFHLAVDGLSLLLVWLALFLGFVSVVVSWREIKERVGLFHFNLLWVLAGVIGVFLAADLMLFYLFWELMLIPMAFLILVWGYGDRVRSALKFFIFTQASGLAMLVSIVALAVFHARTTGRLSFDLMELQGTPLSQGAARWVMFGFVAAFAVKLPAVPVHTWLPDAHTDAPTAGSVVLAGLLLKTGAYGLLRFVVPLFPQAAAEAAPILMGVGVAGILYGAVVAFAQTDFKRLVAYTSVAHMGFVLLGIFALNPMARQGAVLQMIAHGISTPALFIIAGALQARLHTRDLREMGGLWAVAPRMGAVALFFIVATLGLPGLGNFVAEFLTLAGTFQMRAWMAAVAAAGVVGAAIYALSLMQRSFHGPHREGLVMSDLSVREVVVLGVMMAVLVGLGLVPQPVLDLAGGAHVGP
ncbi:MAG: NADH-quinone oxidoreductase subunit M [Planctomycetes bacterium]|nr:NADH-quinone oxidoreductase subunit M [Planctomycetota bacterium]